MGCEFVGKRELCWVFVVVVVVVGKDRPRCGLVELDIERPK